MERQRPVAGHLSIACLCAIVAGTGCSPNVPNIADPTSVDAHCSPRQARITGIRSVLTSTNDVLDDDRPTLVDIQNAVRSGDGAIAYWHDQRLSIPHTAEKLGESDGYARVRALAIPPALAGSTYRHVYLDVRDHGSYRWVTMQAFDVQNVCIEGHKQD